MPMGCIRNISIYYSNEMFILVLKDKSRHPLSPPCRYGLHRFNLPILPQYLPYLRYLQVLRFDPNVDFMLLKWSDRPTGEENDEHPGYRGLPVPHGSHFQRMAV